MKKYIWNEMKRRKHWIEWWWSIIEYVCVCVCVESCHLWMYRFFFGVMNERMNEWIFVKNNYVKSMYFFMCVCLYMKCRSNEWWNEMNPTTRQQHPNWKKKIESETKKK